MFIFIFFLKFIKYPPKNYFVVISHKHLESLESIPKFIENATYWSLKDNAHQRFNMLCRQWQRKWMPAKVQGSPRILKEWHCQAGHHLLSFTIFMWKERGENPGMLMNQAPSFSQHHHQQYWNMSTSVWKMKTSDNESIQLERYITSFPCYTSETIQNTITSPSRRKDSLQVILPFQNIFV